MPIRLLIGFFLLAYQSATAQGQTYAVAVGISDYEALSNRNGDLRFADRDARQVVAFLQSKAGGGVPAGQIRLLTNQRATQTNIRQALTLFQRAKAGDRIILYFSGHGLPDSFVPYDVQPGDRSNLLTYGNVKAAFRQSAASTKLCIADACLAGGLQRPQTGSDNSAQTLTGPTNAPGERGNVALLLASRSTQYALEDQRLAGGTFTYHLLRGLNGQADRNADRVVTIRELHQYVAPRVRQATRGRQTPIFYGRFSDALALAYL